MLVGNNIVNIAATTIATIVFGNLIPDGALANVLNVVVMTLLVLIFGEILPKSFAKKNPEALALKFSGVFYIVMKVLAPISALFYKFRSVLIKENKNDLL